MWNGVNVPVVDKYWLPWFMVPEQLLMECTL
jgi:hypothetical protein